MIVCLGDLVEDVVVWLRGPIAAGTDTPSRVTRCRGGSAANVAAFVAQSGGASRFIGTVGDDPLGRQLVAQLSDLGMDVVVQHRGRTGSIVVLVAADGERSFLTDRGSSSDVDPVPPAALENAHWLHVPAYCLAHEPLATVATNALASAQSLGVQLSVDCSSTALLETFGPERFLSWLAEVAPDVVFANEAEAVLLSLHQRWAGPGLLVIKHGPAPVELILGNGSVTQVPVEPVATVHDATGAGDAFAAGFLLARSAGATVVEAASAGSRLAGRVLAQPGASMQSLNTLATGES